MANIYGRQVVLPLTNKSGGGVVAGDVVIIDTGNDGAFTTTTTGGYGGSVGIAQETIANNATGRVLTSGYAALVNVPSSQTRGHFIKTHTVAKQATGASSRAAGMFGQLLTGGSTPTAWLWGMTDNAGASGETVATSAIWDAAGDLAVATGADTAAKLSIGAAKSTLYSNGTTASWVQTVKLGTPILRTGGNHTCNSTTWVELAAATGGPGTGTYDFDFTGVAAGDIVEFSISCGWGSEATNGCLTVATIVTGSIVNYFMGAPTSSSGDGIVGLYGFSGTFQGVAATGYYVVQSGDLSAGALKLRPLYRTTSGTNKTLYGSTGDPAMFMAKVFKP